MFAKMPGEGVHDQEVEAGLGEDVDEPGQRGTKFVDGGEDRLAIAGDAKLESPAVMARGQPAAGDVEKNAVIATTLAAQFEFE